VTLLQALVLGLVQGVTGFLPVSATGHLHVLPALFGWHFYGGTGSDPGAPFTAIVRLGTVAAIVVYFWRELLQVTVAWVRGLLDPAGRDTLEYRLGWYLLLASVPAIVLGIAFDGQLDRGAHNLWLVAGALVAVGALLLTAERLRAHEREEEELGTRDVVVVGAAQVLGLVPGASHAGTMIAGGLFRGLTHVAAARFAFLLSVPSVVVAGLYDAARIGSQHDPSPGAGLTGVALVVAFGTGLLSLHWLLRWLGEHSTAAFAYYRVALGVLVLVLVGTGVLEATT
jgi:undecaprenyl-diphosphatase